jgi:hypothetical protein
VYVVHVIDGQFLIIYITIQDQEIIDSLAMEME